MFLKNAGSHSCFQKMMVLQKDNSNNEQFCDSWNEWVLFSLVVTNRTDGGAHSWLDELGPVCFYTAHIADEQQGLAKKPADTESSEWLVHGSSRVGWVL